LPTDTATAFGSTLASKTSASVWLVAWDYDS
jgi:hypothetical protein